MYAINIFGDGRLDIVSAFAISGLTIGVAGGALYLCVRKIAETRGEQASQKITKIKTDKTDKNDKIEKTEKTVKMQVRKSADIIKEIIKISLPIMLSSTILSLAGMIDSFMMKRRLIDIGWTYEAAKETFGDYTGIAVPFFSLPNTLVVPFAVSIIPVIAAAFASKNTNSIKSTIESTFRVASIVATPCAFGIASMSKPILNLIFEKQASAVESTAPLLSVLAFAVVFVSMMTVTNSMLQAQRQEMRTIISMSCGMIVKVVSSYILIGIPAVNRFGTPISTCLCYLTIMSMNFYFLAKHTKVVPPIQRTFMKPFIASAIMSFCTILSYILLNNILKGSKIAVIAALVIAVTIYAVLILAFKTLTRDDVLLLPKGTKIYEAMKKKKLIN
jgi:stage V sporulation protein B